MWNAGHLHDISLNKGVTELSEGLLNMIGTTAHTVISNHEYENITFEFEQNVCSSKVRM